MTETLFENSRSVNIFDKVERIKNLIHEHLPELNEDELLHMLSRCRAGYEGRLYYGRRTSNLEERKRRPPKKLTFLENKLMELLIIHGMSPSTAYRWFLAARVPEDVMHAVKCKNMTVKKAMLITRNRKRMKENQQGWQLISLIREVMRWL